MRALGAAILIGLKDMRGDLRRFGLLVVCLAVGTALIAGVSSVGTSIRGAVDENAALIMGGDIELSRTDRAATGEELDMMRAYGRIASVIDTNVRAESGDRDAFVDLISIDAGYPLFGDVGSPERPADVSPYDFLEIRDGVPGAFVSGLMLEQLDVRVGEVFDLGGTAFEVRGTLTGLPDAAVRGFRLGLPTVITIDGLAGISDRTSPLPGLGTIFRYKLALAEGDAEATKATLQQALGESGWTVRSARDGLGPMVRYYDLFMRFLTIVGLASLLIGGVSVWTGISAYIAERGTVIAVLRAIGAGRSRIFIHFSAQVGMLALVGVGIGLLVGASVALLVLPVVGRSVGIDLAPALHVQPLAVAAGVGLLTAFAFSYVPLVQAQSFSPVLLFRSKGLAAPPVNWRALLFSGRVLPLLIAGAGFFWLATIMTGDALLVLAFGLVSLLAVVLFRIAIIGASWALHRLPEPRNRTWRHALRDIGEPGSNAPAVVVSVGLALAMLVVVLALEVNLRNEYLGASVFDAPTFVASDLFDDEVETLQAMSGGDSDITQFTWTPMLRGALTSVNGAPVATLRPDGPAAQSLLAGEVPLTFRQDLPASSRVVEGQWWPADYAGDPLVSLHEDLRAGLGLKLGDELSFEIFGEIVSARVASFRDYSWQGGIDFLATFSPGVLDVYPSTLLGAVTTAPGAEERVERELAGVLPDVRFIAIGQTLELITTALSQLSLAASLVGGLAVSNGLLVLVGSLATGRRQRQADAVINKVLGATRIQVIAVNVLHFIVLAAFAAVLATPLGIALAYALTLVMLDVEFTINVVTIAAVDLGAVAITGLLGATTILKVLSVRPAHLLREP